MSEAHFWNNNRSIENARKHPKTVSGHQRDIPLLYFTYTAHGVETWESFPLHPRLYGIHPLLPSSSNTFPRVGRRFFHVDHFDGKVTYLREAPPRIKGRSDASSSSIIRHPHVPIFGIFLVSPLFKMTMEWRRTDHWNSLQKAGIGHYTRAFNLGSTTSTRFAWCSKWTIIFLTIEDEIKHLLYSPLSIISVLYYITRYMPLLDTIVSIVSRFRFDLYDTQR